MYGIVGDFGFLGVCGNAAFLGFFGAFWGLAVGLSWFFWGTLGVFGCLGILWVSVTLLRDFGTFRGSALFCGFCLGIGVYVFGCCELWVLCWFGLGCCFWGGFMMGLTF